MSLILLGCECEPDCPPINGTPGPPGPRGLVGIQGLPGINGLNAFGITTEDFIIPEIGASTVVFVNPAQWATPNQVVYVMGVGYFQVAMVGTMELIYLRNLDYAGNLPAGTLVPRGQQVSPAGISGVTGVPGTHWFYGHGPPSVVPGAISEDFYLDQDSGNVFVLN